MAEEAFEGESQVVAEETGSEAAAEETGGPDLTEQFADLSSKFDTVLERLPAEGEDDGEVDLAEFLNESQPTEFEFEEEQPDYDAEGDEEAQLASYVREQAQEAIAPILAQQEQERRYEQLTALVERYPEMGERDTAGQIAEVVHKIADSYGNDGLRDDPVLVELVFKALQADKASAAEKKAEDAKKEGAKLEQGAARTDSGSDSEDESVIEEILNAGGGRGSVF